MDKPFQILGIPVSVRVLAPVFLVTWVVVGLVLKKAVFTWLERLGKRTETQLDDIVIHALNLPVTVMIFVWGVAALAHLVGPSYAGPWLHPVTLGSKIATLLAIILFVDILLQSLLVLWAGKHEILRFSQGFGTVLIHVLVLSIGGLMVLDSVGVSITPVIASLGLGSLAVALALQPTLENFISGFQILIDQPIKPGHYIKLDSGEEGFVEKIGWRSTWVRQLPNNMLIIPNKQLVNARLINFHYPTPELAVAVEVGVHYNSDLSAVERVCTEVAHDILQRIPGGVPEFSPVVRFHTFGPSSIDFTVVLRGKQFTDSGLLKHEFIKALSGRFALEKIVIPYPIVALNTSQEAAQPSIS